MRFVKTLVLGITLMAAVPGLHAQAKPASGAGASPTTAAAAKPAPQAPKTAGKPAAAKSATNSASATPATTKPAPQAAKTAQSSAPTSQSKPTPPAAANKQQAPAGKPGAPVASTKTLKPAAKPASTAKTAPKPAAKKSARRQIKPASATTSSPATDKEIKVAKRDPFESLIGRERGSSGPTGPLPAGKLGLQVSSLRLDGIVRAPNGMIAVVSNPQSRTYFLREGDQLFDGRVEKIAMDGVAFNEVGKDAFGKPVERQVNKRIYASAGEQQ
jgi:Tfp pilus assembly protein PilP